MPRGDTAAPYNWKNPAIGTPTRGRSDLRQVVLVLPTETFEEVRRRAVVAGTSFAEQARILIEWGLEAK